MPLTHSYEVNIRWEKDRMGIAESPVLKDTLPVATPPEFPKGMPGIWSPEHLLVAATNSCLMTTFLAIAENSRLSFLRFACSAMGKLEMVDGKYMISEITLAPQLTIPADEDYDKALRILQKSEEACLISNSLKSSIRFEPEVIKGGADPVRE